VIIRIFRGHVDAERGDDFLAWAQASAIPHVAGSRGLHELMVGSRGEGRTTHVIIATAWADLEAERSALGGLGARAPALGLPDWIVADSADHFEAIGEVLRPIAEPVGTRLRVLQLLLRPNVSAVFFDRVRAQQAELRQSGELVSALIGRRTVGSRDEYTSIALWRDDAALERATGGAPDRPVGWESLAEWAESYATTTYDAVSTSLTRA
jgi:hypothetical protein